MEMARIKYKKMLDSTLYAASEAEATLNSAPLFVLLIYALVLVLTLERLKFSCFGLD
jgi:hypothetical protein